MAELGARDFPWLCVRPGRRAGSQGRIRRQRPARRRGVAMAAGSVEHVERCPPAMGTPGLCPKGTRILGGHPDPGGAPGSWGDTQILGGHPDPEGTAGCGFRTGSAAGGAGTCAELGAIQLSRWGWHMCQDRPSSLWGWHVWLQDRPVPACSLGHPTIPEPGKERFMTSL